MASGSKCGVTIVFASAVIALVAIVTPLQAQNAGKISDPTDESYRTIVKPIFDKNCSGCHMAGGHGGGLRLDSLSLLLKGGEDGPIVTFGNSGLSTLAKAVHYNDPALQMPPKAKLSDTDITIIDAWIQQSAAPIETVSSSPASLAPPAHQAAVGILPASTTALPQLAAEQEQFFETRIRPVLVNKCYSCHASSAKGGLRLDSRAALLQGGKDGVVVVPGHPESSVISSADPRLR